MKTRRVLAILLALCLLVSAVSTGMILPATAASGTLGTDRVTGNDQLRGYVSNVTSTLGNGNNLFDGTLGTKMEGGWPGSVTVTFEMDQARTVTAYTMGTNDDGNWPDRQPITWTLSGSNDQVTYTVLDTVENAKVYNETQVYYDEDFRVDNPGAYQYYKLEITAYAGGGYFQISELVLTGYDLTALNAVEAKIAALGEITSLDKETAVTEARAAYDALDVKASVNNVDVLVAAEAQIAELKAIADAAGLAQDQEKATAFVEALYAIGDVTYKSEPAIEAAEAAWAALSDADKTALATYGEMMTNARTAYENIIDSFAWVVTNNRPTENAKVTLNSWLRTVSDDMWNATRADLADSVKYAYSNGRDVGFSDDNGVSEDFGGWMSDSDLGGWYHLPMHGGDNYNAQAYHSNFTVLTAAYPGMGFVVDTTFAQNYYFAQTYAVGEAFDWNGVTYQVFWAGTHFYNSVEPVGGSKDVPAITRYNWHPEEGLEGALTDKNIFRYAYAKYSSENRWDGLTYGVPQSDWATEVNNGHYQKYVGPQGVAYLVSTLDQIEAAPAFTEVGSADYAEKMADSYYAITGELANAFDQAFGATSAVDTDKLSVAGNLITVSEDKVVFANGVLTKDGYTANDVSDLFDIDANGTLLSEDGAAKWNAKITWDDAYTMEEINAMVDFKDYGVYYGVSEDAVNAAYEANGAAYDADRNMIANKISFVPDEEKDAESVTVYTTYGFQLNGVPTEGERAVMFYVTYEYNDVEYTFTASNVLDLGA